ncbi:MAG: hypothetical protein CYPHOPRED_004881 [Cyphobasidiales sp. Tagirdzhanova-0007]|nr:MAG: hypothetical protein CYPHOPRED_004881 [Cyphobasidiales sp. Tagirdzhanova-0007]
MHALHVHTIRPSKSQSTYDLGFPGVLVHLVGDAVNNLFVIASAVIVWQTSFSRADAIASLLVGLIILGTAVPLLKRTGRFLLEIAPSEIDLSGIEKNINSLDGVLGIHELHAFSLTQKNHVASLHVILSPEATVQEFDATAKTIREGLHGGVTVQPELPGLMTETLDSSDRLSAVNEGAAKDLVPRTLA